MQKILLLAFLAFNTHVVLAQIGIGEWRSHLNLNRAIKTVETEDRIYCATENGLFFASKNDNSLTVLSTEEGLSGVKVVNIGYDASSKNVFVAYEGGGVDMLGEDYIVEIPYISQTTSIIGDKDVNNFHFANGYAYMATDFGIVVYDIAKREVRESYLNLSERGNKLRISDVEVFNGNIYASSAEGLRYASLNSNLLDFNFWETLDRRSCTELCQFEGELLAFFPQEGLEKYDGSVWQDYTALPNPRLRSLEVHHETLVVAKPRNIILISENGDKDSVLTNAASHALLDENNFVWVSNTTSGLLRFNEARELRFVSPNGPRSGNCWDIDYGNDKLWVASGGLDLAYNPRGLNDGVYQFSNQSWRNFHGGTVEAMKPLRDCHLVRVDAERNKTYIASYNKGLLVFDEEENAMVFGKENSDEALQSPENNPDPEAPVRIAGMDLDTQGHLWMSLQYAQNQLAVKMNDDRWKSFNIGSNKRVNDVLVDHDGQKWIIVHLDGIYVLDDGGTPLNENDDRVAYLSQNVGNGALPAPDVYSMAVDKDGDVWVGTSDGVAVFYSPDQIFNSEGRNFDAQRPLITIGDVTGVLLEGQKVNCITVDGANQKWFGTNNGVFVTNEDGDEIIHRFTVENSPLLSNVIRRIGINGESGEVFIATDNGLISYRSQTTEGEITHSAVKVFPNPVHPDYSGPITINGLVENANVKITDISGNIVFETQAKGGTAVWNGRTFSGNNVATGVYMAFSSNRRGNETFITKIMIIR